MRFVKGFKLSILILILLMIVGCANENNSNSGAEDTGNDSELNDEAKGNESTSSENSGGELQVAVAQQPPVIDTHVSQAQTAADIAKQVFETLVTVDSSGEIQPMLAESWEQSDDGLQITFNLREDILFHNGEKMTAEDVVASMNRWIEITGVGKEQFPEAYFESDGDYTAILNLAQPTSTSLPILAYSGGAFAAIMPKEVIEEAEAEGVKDYVGTGPFKFEEWKQDQYIHLSKFDDYEPLDQPADGIAGKKEALVDDIYFNFVSDASTRVSGIIAGTYDIAHSIPFDSAEQIENNPDLESYIYDAGFLSYYFNKRKGIFTDKTAREAVRTALDMEEVMIASYANDQFYHLNHNMMLKSQEGQWYSEVGQDRYNINDLDKGKQLLSETNYDGEEINILTTREHEQSYNAAIVLQQVLESLGMEAEVSVTDRPTFEELREDEDAFDIFVLQNTPKPEPSSNVYLREDFGGWTDSPELDEIVAEFRGKPSLEEAQEVYNDLQDWFYDYIPIIKVGDYSGVVAHQDYIENFEYIEGYKLWNVSKNE